MVDELRSGVACTSRWGTIISGIAGEMSELRDMPVRAGTGGIEPSVFGFGLVFGRRPAIG